MTLLCDVFSQEHACRVINLIIKDKYWRTLATAIIHGDIGTGNILVDDGQVSGVIDFAGCSIGDPAHDLASLSAGLGDDFLALMHPYYPGIDAMQDQIRFYRSTFPLLDVLFGLEHGDDVALNAGLEALRRG
nr:phosphotransferase [Ensifer sp. NM-2]